MSWLRFASDWRNGPLQRRPWLPWLGMALLAGLADFIAWGYERDWWVFREPPHSYRPTRVNPVNTEVPPAQMPPA